MLWYKAWRESSVRFLLSAALLTCMCVTYSLLFSRLYPGLERDHPVIHDYTRYIFWTVFGGTTRGMLQLTCLVLGLGGLQRDRRQDTLGFTLALPVSRVQLVLSRATMGLAQVFVLCMLPPFLIAGTAMMVHQPYSLWYGMHFVPLWVIGGIFTYSVSLLFSVLFANEYVSLVSAYMVYMFYLAGTRHPRLSEYHLHVADLMSGLQPGYLNRTTMLWGATYPLMPLVGFGLAGVILLCLAAAVTRRQDL